MVGLIPVKHATVEAFVRDNKRLLAEMLAGNSSPIHFLFPQVFAENVTKYKRVLSDYKQENNIFYSCKSNKSNAFIEMACQEGIGVEVSSYFELQDSLRHGILGPLIIVGGPGKTKQYLLLALTCGATISVDSELEFKEIARLCRETNLRANALLRVRNAHDKSRFGIDAPVDREVMRAINRNRRLIDIVGFSAHLHNDVGVEPKDRPELIATLMKLCYQFKRLGFINCNIIDIGGGFTQNFTTVERWKKYNRRKEQFWNRRIFGHTYAYYSEHSGSDGLKFILQYPKGRKPLYELLRKNGFKLALEPGGSLLNNAGITVMSVTDVKKIERNHMILVDGNINHLSQRLFGEYFLLDPELISFSRNSAPFEGYIGGNTCMEDDMVSWHKVRFRKSPAVGDVLVFYNTAGYWMDSNESNFMRMPLPRKICVIRTHDSWKIFDDELFTRAELLG